MPFCRPPQGQGPGASPNQQAVMACGLVPWPRHSFDVGALPPAPRTAPAWLQGLLCAGPTAASGPGPEGVGEAAGLGGGPLGPCWTPRAGLGGPVGPACSLIRPGGDRARRGPPQFASAKGRAGRQPMSRRPSRAPSALPQLPDAPSMVGDEPPPPRPPGPRAFKRPSRRRLCRSVQTG